jgi:hypothetical protein
MRQTPQRRASLLFAVLVTLLLWARVILIFDIMSSLVDCLDIITVRDPPFYPTATGDRDGDVDARSNLYSSTTDQNANINKMIAFIHPIKHSEDRHRCNYTFSSLYNTPVGESYRAGLDVVAV